MPLRSVRRATLVVACLTLASLACSKHTTAPAVRVVRTVTIVLTDDAGHTVAGAPLTVISGLDSAGVTPVRYANTNALGAVVLSLGSGPWTAVVEPLTGNALRRVAAAMFGVPYSDRAAGDTVLVALVLATSSLASGDVTLQGSATSAGTIVSSPELLYPTTTTGSTGHWSLGDLPPGTWHLTFAHAGYSPAVRTIAVPHAGALVTVPSFALTPLAAAPARASR